MDIRTWQATVYGAERVGHDLASKPPPPLYMCYTFPFHYGLSQDTEYRCLCYIYSEQVLLASSPKKKNPKSHFLPFHSPLIPSPLLCSANTLGLFPAQDLGLGYCFCLGHSSLKQSCTFSFTWVELKCHLLRETFLDQSS